MIKAVFFDWFNTLARYDPPREELYRQVLQEFGINLPLKAIIRGIMTADRHYFEENAKSKVEERSPEEKLKVYSHYPRAVLAEAGVKAPEELPLKIIKRVQGLYKGLTFVLFDDVPPTLKSLKQQNFILGLLTNLARDASSICRGLGLETYLDVIVSSGELGVDKPDSRFFRAALERAGVNASEAVHVGDQYASDIVGARGVGITPILIDRYDVYPEVSDCPRIHRLTELAQYL